MKQGEKMIYFDNAATSWPKPSETKEEMLRAAERYGANPGRGGYAFAKETSAYMESARKEIADFLGVIPSRHLIFTGGNTESANLVIKSCLRPGDHAICTSMEHNAVYRPLKEREKHCVELTEIPYSRDKETFLGSMEAAIKPNTRLIAVNHGSNVFGAVTPLREVIDLAKKYRIPVFADMAQTAGFLDFPAAAEGLDFAAYAGHKGLLGYGGIGLLYIRDPQIVSPLIHGGTGSLSRLTNQPRILPSGFEAGTRNLIGIGALLGGVRYLKKRGLASVREHEMNCYRRFREGLRALNHIEIYEADLREHLPVISFNVKDLPPAAVALALDQKAGICGRAGLHCSPSAHRVIGTEQRGTLRFSFGPFNTAEEVDIALNVLNDIR